MKYPIILFIFFAFYICSFGQDTFSIVAIDSVTGEVGSAGATCLDATVTPLGALIISDVLPGKGAIHTQSFYLSQNQQNANFRMQTGQTPQQIIDWLVQNDAQGDSTTRQYGIVAFNSSGGALQAAFTGSNCLDENGHRLGNGYAIQGNILIETAILDSMEARFLRTQGTLAERLMAALQGANVPGADSRCLMEGVSSRSAFVRVAKPGDTQGNFHLDINVPLTPFGKEPIDSVQVLFDQWNMALALSPDQETPYLSVSPNPAKDVVQISLNNPIKGRFYQLEVYSMQGKLLSNYAIGESPLTLAPKEIGPAGAYVCKLSEKGRMVYRTILVALP